MHIVEVYRTDKVPYEVVVDRENLFDLVFMLQNYERCLQFRVHSAAATCITVDYFLWSGKHFTKWVTKFDYSL